LLVDPGQEPMNQRTVTGTSLDLKPSLLRTALHS